MYQFVSINKNKPGHKRNARFRIDNGYSFNKYNFTFGKFYSIDLLIYMLIKMMIT
jgi:hypothetical protein